MARRSKRVVDDEEDEGHELAPQESEGAAAAANAATDTAADAPSTPPPAASSSSAAAKRKREDGPPTNEEAELARRRRRRQSLVFQQRRKSLTLHSGGNSEDKSNRQYISDMYQTVIKMSSENKINVKNSWSLHLIDHMQDILHQSPQKGKATAAGDADQVDTATSSSEAFNFQKASCTLDASVKIYSYRVDDTWTSSYKILENLSRSGNQKKRGEDGHDEDAGSQDEGDGEDDGADDDTKKTAMKKKSRSAGAAKTIEKNLNNITLKQYEVEFEPDPLFHKMSQTFDEGGAKGMLLANLGVYDGVKLLLNSNDVKLSTRQLIKPPNEAEDAIVNEDVDNGDDDDDDEDDNFVDPEYEFDGGDHVDVELSNTDPDKQGDVETLPAVDDQAPSSQMEMLL
ncbi:hypothetical protein PINS_up021947 [Pythium insidiosum]|nr:hypothetical protein PINS_up021947 [Pythium insidiosum]